MSEEQKPETDFPSFFWLASVRLIYTVDGGLERQRDVSILVKTLNPYLTQETLNNVNFNAQVQAQQQKKIPRKAKIIDAVIQGPWMIGHMTDAQFLENSGEGGQLHITEEQPTNGEG